MKLKINGNYYELHFGIKFINRIDHKLGVTVEGMKTDLTGIQPAVLGLSTSDPAILATVIYCAIDDGKVTEDMINDYLENGDADLNDLFVEVVKAMEDSVPVNFQLVRITGKKLSQIIKITNEKAKRTTKSSK